LSFAGDTGEVASELGSAWRGRVLDVGDPLGHAEAFAAAAERETRT